MKKVLLTGANGFIGSYVLNELIQHGYYVYALIRDIKKVNCINTSASVSYITCDMEQYLDLKNRAELKNIDAILHLAWAGVSNIEDQGYEVQLANVKYSCDLMEVARYLKIPVFLYAGSLMEFEHLKAFSENYYNVSKRNIYHVAKFSARNMLQILANNYDIIFLPITISNVYGVGEISNRLINTAIRKMLSNTPMPFTSAKQLYDFIYISDAATAIRLVLEQGKKNKNYYIGNEKQKPLREFLTEMRDVLNPGYYLDFGAIPFKGVSLMYNEFNTKGLYEDTTFIPEFSFKEGIIKTAKWMKENGYEKL